ncbi:HU family DNA-binding protein [Bacteroides sp. 214]|uniref:HU family DNA-binding protein n=1 Tax=Bacteroides sp. 214 TaxID=2302935 RepID=UPI0013D7157E|nr:HU family DNA-binding protein [Bacteroides sp. 214]NDW12951.1 HU family DNA-binding protein [Bacteroides sp. 214]
MADRITIPELVKHLFEKEEGFNKKNSEIFIKEFFALIKESLESEGYVKIKGFGTFKLIEVESRESVDINTGKRIEIKGHSKVSFTPDTVLKESINKPFAHFETVVLNDNVSFEDTLEDSEIKTETEETPIIPPVPTTTEAIKEPKLEEPLQKEVPVTKTLKQPAKTAASSTPKKTKTERKPIWLWVLLTVVIIVIGAACYFSYKTEIDALLGKSLPQDEQVEVTTPAVQTPEEPETDTPEPSILPVDSVETTATPTEASPQQTIIPKRSHVVTEMDTTTHQIVGTKATRTLKEGETLVRLALEYYGTKDLWPFIYIHNKAKISNPNVVPPGVTLNIPELQKK